MCSILFYNEPQTLHKLLVFHHGGYYEWNPRSQNSRWCNTNYCEGAPKHWKGPYTAREHKSFSPYCGPLGPESTTETRFVQVGRLCHSSTGILDGNIWNTIYCKSSSPQAQAVQHYMIWYYMMIGPVGLSISETVKVEFMLISHATCIRFISSLHFLRINACVDTF